MKWIKWLSVLCLSICLVGCQNVNEESSSITFDSYTIEEYDGQKSYVVLNDNVPVFSDTALDLYDGEEYYSRLDRMDRCGMVCAKVGRETMPTEKRESIGMVRPTGWQISKYDHIDGQYLYNRCHLIGFQLTAENANERNLITGTRYMNVDGMLPFENWIGEYVRESGNHVLYEVTPVFMGREQVARGVHMQAESIEDDSLSFNVFAYNVQPGVEIEYMTGENHPAKIQSVSNKEAIYVINMNSKKVHLASCQKAKEIKEENRRNTDLKLETLEKMGYKPAQCCRNGVDHDDIQEYVINLNSGKFHRADCINAQKIKKENYKKVKTTYQNLIEEGYISSECCK